jgi:Trk K+ transport system NAD-binding subunit
VRLIVVGASGATRALLRRLGERWEVAVVDPNADLLARSANVREIEQVLGDGSSRVTLGKARIGEADALVAASGDDDINLEVCRLGIDAGLVRVMAIGVDPERLTEYRDLGVPSFSSDALAARQIEIQLEPRRVSSTAFADGRAEALEVRITDDSPVRGLALKDLHSEAWLVAAVVRKDQFIVPHGSTVLEVGDLVTVVGASHDYSRIVRAFTSGEARFPLDFGKGVLVAIDSPEDADGALGEAFALTRSSAAGELIVAHRDTRHMRDESQIEAVDALLDRVRGHGEGVDVRFHPVDGVPSKRVESVLAEQSVGVVVVPAPPAASTGRAKAIRLLRQTRRWETPVLFARGSHPYHEVVAPARATPAGVIAARAAIDIAGSGNGTVTAVAVISPAFITGSDNRDEAVRALALVREEASILDVPVHRVLRQGNPVRLIESSLEGANLLVLGRPERGATLLTPGIVGHLLQRSEISVLLMPQPR